MNLVFCDREYQCKKFAFNITKNNPIQLIHKQYLIQVVFEDLAEYRTAKKDINKKI
tara:strand:- start:528 stop:695 length:168 start_codon:yes stop_codon:yes gene_type:complete